MLKHIGIRPIQKLITYGPGYKEIWGYRYELFPDGGYRKWSMRTLESGCRKVVSGDKTLRGLIYCSECDEYFSTNQFLVMEESV